MIITESEDKSMQELKKRIHENGIDYVLVGDYYVPKLKMPERKKKYRALWQIAQRVSETSKANSV